MVSLMRLIGSHGLAQPFWYPEAFHVYLTLGGALTLWWAREGFWPWACEFRRLFFHLRHCHKIWNCHRCHRLLWPLEAVYACESCEDMYFCVRCRECISHEHALQCDSLSLTVETDSFARAKSAAEALLISFHVYSERPCLGSCPAPNETSDRLGCNWHSYSQVGQASKALAEGIHHLLDERLGRPSGTPIVGLLAAVSKQWFITDFACTLAGIPLVTMHRATDEKALAHLLDESGLVLLVASKHLSAVIARAHRQASNPHLKMVIWIDDARDPYSMQYASHLSAIGSLELDQVCWTSILQQGATLLSAGNGMRLRDRHPKAIIKLLPSSGSTGLPKLVPVTEDQLFKVGNLQSLQCSLDVVVYAAW